MYKFRTPSVSLDSSSQQHSGEAWPEMMLTAEGTPGDGWSVHQVGVAPDSSDTPCPRLAAAPCGPGASAVAPGARRTELVERRELKLARLKQIMQRSLSESDSDVYPPEDGKTPGASACNTLRPDRPTHLPIAEEEPAVTKNLPCSSSSSSTGEKKPAFPLSGSRSADGVAHDPSPTSSDPEAPDAAATSPKSALKSPSARRKTSQTLKLRVTFDEQVHKSSNPEAELTAKVHHGKERTQTGGGSEGRRPFGAFRSIMESLSGNTNHNNNNNNSQTAAACQNSPGRKSESRGGGAKVKSKSSNV